MVKRRSPSDVRNLLEVRARRLAQTYDREVRKKSLQEIIEISTEYYRQLEDEDREEPK